MSMKRKLLNTSAARITKVYGLLLLGITLILSITIVSVVGYKQYRLERQQAVGVARGLKRSFIANRNDWFWWRLGNSTDTHNTFVRIQVTPTKKKSYALKSPRTKRFLAQQQAAKTHRLSDNISYSSKVGLYYHVSATDEDRDNGIAHVQYDVWLKLNGVIYLLWLLIRLILLIVLAFFALGIWLIYLLARQLNRPLADLTETTKTINHDLSNQYQTQLPVPKSPQEVHDLSEAFNQLLASLNQQARADREFVSNASHELKTPIATIRGHVSLIKRRGKDHPEVIPSSLEFIDQESERMQRLVQSLLKLSRANQLTLVTAPVNVSQLVTNTVDGYGASLSQDVLVHVAPDIVAEVNADSVEQILVSLLNNAQKYSPAQSTIVVGLTSTPHSLQLSVTDQGRGIADDQKAHIFDRFYRAKTVRATVEGNGLGLAIVQQLVTLHHGQIEVSDNHPTGTKFVIKLPI